MRSIAKWVLAVPGALVHCQKDRGSMILLQAQACIFALLDVARSAVHIFRKGIRTISEQITAESLTKLISSFVLMRLVDEAQL
jgi:hypothetical protein